MHVVRYRGDVGIGVGVSVASASEIVGALPFRTFGELLHLELDELKSVVSGAVPVSKPARPLAPVDSRMEVWASGVSSTRCDCGSAHRHSATGQASPRPAPSPTTRSDGGGEVGLPTGVMEVQAWCPTVGRHARLCV